jgi:hypothetical protein
MDLRIGDIPKGPMVAVNNGGMILGEEIARRVIMRPAGGQCI